MSRRRGDTPVVAPDMIEPETYPETIKRLVLGLASGVVFGTIGVAVIAAPFWIAVVIGWLPYPPTMVTLWAFVVMIAVSWSTVFLRLSIHVHGADEETGGVWAIADRVRQSVSTTTIVPSLVYCYVLLGGAIATAVALDSGIGTTATALIVIVDYWLLDWIVLSPASLATVAVTRLASVVSGVSPARSEDIVFVRLGRLDQWSSGWSVVTQKS